jgi:hypothetical protein
MRATTTGRPKVARAYSLAPRQMVITNRTIPVSSGRFVIDGQPYLAPRPAVRTVRFGVLAEGGLDLDLDGAPNESFGVAVVALSPGRLLAFVDTDGDRSFADETALSDWNSGHATATFGQDRPETADVVEVRPFGLNLCQRAGLGPCAQPSRRTGDAWSLVTGTTSGTASASVAAGHDLRLGGGHFDGVAPGAELWMFYPFGPDREVWGSDWATSIVLAAREGADVIVASTTLARTFFPDHVDVLSSLVDNIIDAYDVPVVAPAAGTVGLGASETAPQASRKALLVAPSMHPDTFAVLNGRRGIGGERLGDPFVVSGPHLTTGRPTPDVVAPSPTLFAKPRFTGPNRAFTPDGTPVALPAELGTGLRWGEAAPTAGGAIALLISAARAEHVRYDAHTLKRALELSARPLRGDHAFTRTEIGGGLIQVGHAWQWLQQLSRGRAADNDLRATVAGDYPAGSGDSIYQRTTTRSSEQVTLSTSQASTRTYRLGADQPWLRMSQTTITVPGTTRSARGGRSATTFAVHIDPGIRTEPGLYTGSIVVDDPTTTDPGDLRVPVTVVTPWRFDADNQLRFTGHVAANTNRPLFVTVPSGTKRLTVTFRRPASQPAGIDLFFRQRDPSGAFDTLYVIRDHGSPSGIVTDVIDTPDPGTLELTLSADEASRPAGQPIVDQHPYDITVVLEQH